MNEYIIQNGELYHYGVKGMKWGVRKNPSLAYNRAAKKKRRLDDRAERLQTKADKKRAKADKVGARYAGWGYASASDVQKTSKAAYRAERKADKAAKKADKWNKAMDKAFADMSVSKLSEKELATGKNFINTLMFGKEQYRVEKKEK